ncbi:hypothetical protein JOC36_001437 [Weissella uvarum]|uniref:hypothetical protein n=1 Tax=Weissella uvarum TaxID=1479233 RepID=UPI001960AE70|nr:hypothetical protein [Weissella uvarum]MBM7617844.1 hypothetical protein [Weissella uvarum]MCM0596158.1 hypothetical protein [Weissella uvarum]
MRATEFLDVIKDKVSSRPPMNEPTEVRLFERVNQRNGSSDLVRVEVPQEKKTIYDPTKDEGMEPSDYIPDDYEEEDPDADFEIEDGYIDIIVKKSSHMVKPNSEPKTLDDLVQETATTPQPAQVQTTPQEVPAQAVDYNAQPDAQQYEAPTQPEMPVEHTSPVSYQENMSDEVILAVFDVTTATNEESFSKAISIDDLSVDQIVQLVQDDDDFIVLNDKALLDQACQNAEPEETICLFIMRKSQAPAELIPEPVVKPVYVPKEQPEQDPMPQAQNVVPNEAVQDMSQQKANPTSQQAVKKQAQSKNTKTQNTKAINPEKNENSTSTPAKPAVKRRKARKIS